MNPIKFFKAYKYYKSIKNDNVYDMDITYRDLALMCGAYFTFYDIFVTVLAILTIFNFQGQVDQGYEMFKENGVYYIAYLTILYTLTLRCAYVNIMNMAFFLKHLMRYKNIHAIMLERELRTSLSVGDMYRIFALDCLEYREKNIKRFFKLV